MSSDIFVVVWLKTVEIILTRTNNYDIAEKIMGRFEKSIDLKKKV